MAQKTNLRAVHVDVEEMEKQIKAHKLANFRKVAIVVGILLVLFLAAGLWNALRRYDKYDVTDSTELHISTATKFVEFQDMMVFYSNDGISGRDKNLTLTWNQSYEMSNPQTDLCEEYLVVFDKGGSSLYIVGTAGVVKKIETISPIQMACVANQGTVAVLMKEGETSYIKLYDKNGKELAGGEFYGEKGSFPIDIALSGDAKKLAIDFVDVTDGKVKTTISFYNFGSVGQNEIDNNVGTYSYDDIMIAKIKYVSDNRMVALGDKAILIFEGSQKPSLARQIDLENNLQSVFMDNKYIGTVCANEGEDISYHVCVYGMLGNVVMEKDTSIAYNEVEFLRDLEICFRNETACEIYTIHGVEKFHSQFEEEIRMIFGRRNSRDYVFISDGKAEEVRLR